MRLSFGGSDLDRPDATPESADRATDDAGQDAWAAEAAREEQHSSASREVRFPCSQCGANLRWTPEHDALTCDYCGHRVEVVRGEGTVLERPLSEAGAAARGLGLERRAVRCGNCGATVTLDGAATADNCVYCGSSNVMEQAANRNAIRPESLIPLAVSRRAVEEKFRAWLRGLWFRPNDLKQARNIEAIGVYLPYWTFDCNVHSDWSADAGYYYYVTRTYWTTVNGQRVMRTRRERRVRWVPASGARDDAYDDALVCASVGVSPDLVNKLGAFDTHELVPYKPEYLAGWRAEEYQVDLTSAWAHCQSEIEQEQRARCSRDVPGDTQRNLRVRNAISDVRWKHVLLPLWIVQYRYRGRAFSVLVHGQTARVVGHAPYSWVKIALAVAGGLAAIGGVGAVIAIAQAG